MANKNGPPADTALELMKQLITLSSGVLALSATFISEFATSSFILIAVLGVAWLALIFAVLAGLETISAIVKSRLSEDYDWSEGYGKRVAQVSKYSFVIGLALFASFALFTLSNRSPSSGRATTANSEVTNNAHAAQQDDEADRP